MSDILPVLRLATIGGSMFLAGYITSFSYVGIPVVAMVQQTEILVRQWSRLYGIGASSAPFIAASCAISFSFLAYTSRNSSTLIAFTSPMALYSAAALFNISIAPYTILAMRPAVNDELAAMAKAAERGATGKDVGESAHIQKLLKKWTAMNYVRAILVITGAVFGGMAALRENLHS